MAFANLPLEIVQCHFCGIFFLLHLPSSHASLLGIMLLFSRSVVSDSLQPHGLQHARLPYPSLSPGICSNSCPLSW